ncbi:conserved protein of unknown function [Candidatus Nitrosocosmicus franklandus]|uniref:OLD protein-like TOPRIM domain-containing protein n=2 Tax=Candidatus Nitrosocosmicus franklandianus TaxID=1798806 RepID=A0A484ICW3_9ARCH|nr:conserved protein of unknown function [Candidatus Nitrosocosmicus franklandus]
MEKAARDLELQFIIVTHSLLFVNSKTIHKIHRFYKENGKWTKSNSPTITSNENILMDILTYSNSVKIFFASKVVLVEGDSDEYFYRYFYEYYKKINNKKDDLEFIDIWGKDHFKNWKTFLTKYNIPCFYIGDLDNVLNPELGFITRSTHTRYQKKLLSQVKKTKSKSLNNSFNFLEIL